MFKLKNSLKIILHVIAISIIYYFSLLAKGASLIPDNYNLLNWDAAWYSSIKDAGYMFEPSKTSNLAFFPLFPLLWKVTNFSPILISIFNLLLFIGSYYFLNNIERKSTLFNLFILSIPSFIFFALPYSESVFFLSATLLITGFKKNISWLKYLGFFLCSFARSISVLFIPAIIISEIISTTGAPINKYNIKTILYSCIASFGGLFSAVLIQAFQTGKWFYFIEVQKFWNRQWLIPHFPLTTISPFRMAAIDGIAVIVGIGSIFCVLFWIWIYISSCGTRHKEKKIIDQHIIFSVLCLAGITILDLFFTYNEEGRTNIWSINRHLMCTPFFIVVLANFINYESEVKYMKYFYIILIFLGVYITGVYEYFDLTIYYFVFFTALFLFKYYKNVQWYIALAILLNIAIQVQFYGDFLNNGWIG